MLRLLLAAVVAVVGSVASFAADERANGTFPGPKKVENYSEYRTHFGVSAGYNIPEGDPDTTPEIGVNLGYQPYVPFGVGVELSTSKFDSDQRADYRRTTALAYATYNLGGTIPIIHGSYIGLAAGPAFLNDGTELAVAPLLGFDLPLATVNGRKVTLGLNAKYLIVTDATDSLITNAALKFWF